MTTIDMCGQVLVGLRIEYSVVLYFNGEWVVLLGGSFTLGTQGATHRFTPAVDPPDALKPMGNLLGQRVTQAEIGDNGSLSITFDDGSRLHAEPDPDYEAWNLSGPDGLVVVCMAGGTLATWSGIAPAVDGDPPDGAG
ncbi:Uncharacterised protein [Mycobacteroides abscessus subsp. abscessus]|nr:Uncharacterised protein [Mycobacteroides abscessus subsp. abscessus]